MNPKPETSNTIDAGFGTSLIASEVVESLTKIVFSVPP
jgi:hypothetical protein